jgi:transposase
MLERGLSAQRIWQDLTADHGFPDSYQSVQRFVRKLRATSPLPFRRMECEPGEEAQVDFGKAAPVITPDGQRRPPHLFRIVLSHSRKTYSEAACSTARSAHRPLTRCGSG